MTKFDPSQIQWRVPWFPIPPELDAPTVAELRREVPTGHVLSGRTVQTVGHRQDCDDVLFYLGESVPQFAVVHLTYVRETLPEWPGTMLFDTLDAWIEQGMIPDAEELGSNG